MVGKMEKGHQRIVHDHFAYNLKPVDGKTRIMVIPTELGFNRRMGRIVLLQRFNKSGGKEAHDHSIDVEFGVRVVLTTTADTIIETWAVPTFPCP